MPGYTEELKPRFISTDSTFKVVLMNVNYKENSAIGTQNTSIETKLTNLSFKKNTREIIVKLYQIYGIEKVFGRTNIADTCGISYSYAGDLIKAMKSEKLIDEVDGHGKGKYRFVL